MATQTYIRLGGRVWHRERITSVAHTFGSYRGNRIHLRYAQDVHFPWYLGVGFAQIPIGHNSRSYIASPIDFSFPVATRSEAEAYVAFLKRICPNLQDTKPDELTEGPLWNAIEE